MALALACAALVSAALTIRFDRARRQPEVYIFRMATMALIITAAAVRPAPVPASYKTFVLAGLAASLAGDVFMMLPRKRFAAGLVAFLAANGFYILAFRPAAGRPVPAGLLLPFILLALLMFRTLAPGLGVMKGPVLVYIGTVSAMAWLASNRYVETGGTRAFLAMAGALLFLASDAVLAINRFTRPFAAAQAVILGLYFPAQILIALSV